MFDWKQIIAGVVTGAVLGIAGTFFAFQQRLAFLEGRFSANKNDVVEVRYDDQKNSPSSTIYWAGSWQHTEVIVGGSFSGPMQLTVDGSRVKGWSANAEGGRSQLSGTISPDGKELAGTWENPITGHRGLFLLRLLTPTLFQGNYALEGKPIRDQANLWTGIRKP